MFSKFRGWLLALSTIGKIGVITGASVVAIGTAGVIAGQNPAHQTNTQPKVEAASVEHKVVKTTEAVPFDTQTVDDSNLAVGTDQTVTDGVNGVKTKTYDVTFTKGVETNRTLTNEVITTQPITKIVHHGTFVAASCPNGTYVNSAGNTVCSPYNAPSTPAGATAQCRDGTYSFSQSRSGTCSHHGGVAAWL